MAALKGFEFLPILKFLNLSPSISLSPYIIAGHPPLCQGCFYSVGNTERDVYLFLLRSHEILSIPKRLLLLDFDVKAATFIVIPNLSSFYHNSLLLSDPVSPLDHKGIVHSLLMLHYFYLCIPIWPLHLRPVRCLKTISLLSCQRHN